jgi:hypothetical protein
MSVDLLVAAACFTAASLALGTVFAMAAVALLQRTSSVQS